ncbi:Uncharacterised protein [Enterobacter cancerogenus]|uniref:Uncharacterized protein n=1 Tax=Enterobacter cancerogenus TaxID=69218 RepID=A0A484YN99_9ENTR|nr:Uncharacterised protein [Enterobacter cancerogenus]
MKKYFLVLTFSALAILYCVLMTRSFMDEEYTQRDFLQYYLLTPEPLRQAPRLASHWYFTRHADEGSGLQISTLTFTDIEGDKIQSIAEKLNAYIDSYPRPSCSDGDCCRGAEGNV